MNSERPDHSPEERQALLLQRINTEGRVLAAAAAVDFGISEDSIRRDLKELVEAGLVQRFHGGASRLVTPILDFRKREALGSEDKQRIGEAAAMQIEDGATVLVDTSTTLLHFVRSIPRNKSVRIITTAPDIAAVALDHPLTEVSMLGGRQNRHTRSATGPLTVEAIRKLRADYCILGTCGVDEDLYLRADDIEDAYVKAAMIKVSAKTFLLASGDKFGMVATHEVAHVSAITGVFTIDARPDMVARMRDAGIEVFLC